MTENLQADRSQRKTNENSRILAELVDHRRASAAFNVDDSRNQTRRPSQFENFGRQVADLPVQHFAPSERVDGEQRYPPNDRPGHQYKTWRSSANPPKPGPPPWVNYRPPYPAPRINPPRNARNPGLPYRAVGPPVVSLSQELQNRRFEPADQFGQSAKANRIRSSSPWNLIRERLPQARFELQQHQRMELTTAPRYPYQPQPPNYRRESTTNFFANRPPPPALPPSLTNQNEREMNGQKQRRESAVGKQEVGKQPVQNTIEYARNDSVTRGPPRYASGSTLEYANRDVQEQQRFAPSQEERPTRMTSDDEPIKIQSTRFVPETYDGRGSMREPWPPTSQNENQPAYRKQSAGGTVAGDPPVIRGDYEREFAETKTNPPYSGPKGYNDDYTTRERNVGGNDSDVTSSPLIDLGLDKNLMRAQFEPTKRTPAIDERVTGMAKHVLNGRTSDRNTDKSEAANQPKQNTTQQKKLTPNGDIKPPSSLPVLKKEKSALKTPTKKASPKSPESGGSSNSLAEKKKVPMNKIQVGAAPSPNLKVVRSKIGSLENYTHKPGGGKVKIENRKLEWKVQPRIEAKNEKYAPSGGDKKIQQVKLQWSAKSKIGSLENATHKPGGGDKKIESVKLDFKDKAKSKIGSKDNIKHVPGGGTVKKPTDIDTKSVSSDIEDQKIDLKVQSKVGSLDNLKHKPGGGDKKIYDDREYIKQMAPCDDSKANGPATSGSQEFGIFQTSQPNDSKTETGKLFDQSSKNVSPSSFLRSNNGERNSSKDLEIQTKTTNVQNRDLKSRLKWAESSIPQIKIEATRSTIEQESDQLPLKKTDEFVKCTDAKPVAGTAEQKRSISTPPSSFNKTADSVELSETTKYAQQEVTIPSSVTKQYPDESLAKSSELIKPQETKTCTQKISAVLLATEQDSERALTKSIDPIPPDETKAPEYRIVTSSSLTKHEPQQSLAKSMVELVKPNETRPIDEVSFDENRTYAPFSVSELARDCDPKQSTKLLETEQKNLTKQAESIDQVKSLDVNTSEQKISTSSSTTKQEPRGSLTKSTEPVEPRGTIPTIQTSFDENQTITSSSVFDL